MSDRRRLKELSRGSVPTVRNSDVMKAFWRLNCDKKGLADHVKAYPLTIEFENSVKDVGTVPQALEYLFDVAESHILWSAALSSEIQGNLRSLSEDARGEQRVELYRTFMAAFRRHATTLQLSKLFEGPEEKDEDMRDRWYRALGSLAPPPAFAMDEGAAWPAWADAGEWDGVQYAAPQMPPVVGALLHPLLSAFVHALPLTGRAIVGRVAMGLSGSVRVANWVPDLMDFQPEGVMAGLLDGLEFSWGSDVTDGRDSNLYRTTRLFAYVASMALAVHAALIDAQLYAIRKGAAISAVCPYPAPWGGVEGRAAARTAAIASMLDVVLHTDTEGFVWTQPNAAVPAGQAQLGGSGPRTPPPPGREPSSSVPKGGQLTLAQCVSTLSGLLKMGNSQYQMPKHQAPQRDWEAWFARVVDLPDKFPAMSASMALLHLMAGTAQDDARIYGWSERVARGEPGELSDFVAHVRKQVLATVTTRRDALTALEYLSAGGYKQVSDCSALATRLQQLYGQIWPSTPCDEVDPLSHLGTVRLINGCLNEAHSKAFGGNMSRAWRAYTSYEAAKLFDQYVEESLHRVSAEASTKLSNDYVIEVCRQLERAHLMYVQTADLRVAAGGGKHHEVHAFENVRGRAGFGRGARGGGRGRKRDHAELEQGGHGGSWAEGAGGQRGRGRGRGESRSRGRGWSAPPTHNAKGLETRERISRNLAALYGSQPKGDRPGEIRSLLKHNGQPLPVVSLAEATRLCLDENGCRLCQRAGHYASKCSMLNDADRLISNRAQKYCAEYSRIEKAAGPYPAA